MYPTTQQLVGLGASQADAERYADHLADACIHYRITAPATLAPFLAQVFHESGRLRYARELWGPTPAQSRYEGRKDLGNLHAGDGRRYMGRGLIQVTGRSNYRLMRDYLRRDMPAVPDFVLLPEQLERPVWAAYSAAAFWDMHGLSSLAIAGDFDGITRRINGGQNGRDDRLALLAQARKVLA